MSSSTASITTPHAKRYLRMLCKHWRHKFEVVFDGVQGIVPFDAETQLQLSATDHQLHLVLRAASSQIVTLQSVVAEHLQRFTSEETLQITWSDIA